MMSTQSTPKDGTVSMGVSELQKYRDHVRLSDVLYGTRQKTITQVMKIQRRVREWERYRHRVLIVQNGYYGNR